MLFCVKLRCHLQKFKSSKLCFKNDDMTGNGFYFIQFYNKLLLSYSKHKQTTTRYPGRQSLFYSTVNSDLGSSCRILDPFIYICRFPLKDEAKYNRHYFYLMRCKKWAKNSAILTDLILLTYLITVKTQFPGILHVEHCFEYAYLSPLDLRAA